LGDIEGLGSGVLQLSTPYAGVLNIKEQMIAEIVPGSESEVLYSGIRDTERWTLKTDNGGWTFARGALTAENSGCVAGITFDELPDAVRVDFSFKWVQAPSIAVCVFADNVDRVHGISGYQLHLNHDYVNAQVRIANSGSSSLGNHRVRGFAVRKRADVTILADRQQHRLAVLYDGALIQQWEDTSGGEFDGKGLVFYSNATMQQISGLTVSRWDGKIPDKSTDSGEENPHLIQ